MFFTLKLVYALEGCLLSAIISHQRCTRLQHSAASGYAITQHVPTLIYWTKWNKGRLELHTWYTGTVGFKLNNAEGIAASFKKVTAKANQGKMTHFKLTQQIICSR